jgi:hypothetical protein
LKRRGGEDEEKKRGGGCTAMYLLVHMSICQYLCVKGRQKAKACSALAKSDSIVDSMQVRR